MFSHEFLTILDEIPIKQKIYFKPNLNPPLNAYHPKMKTKIFVIWKEPDGSFKLNYLAVMNEMAMSRSQLEKMFEEKNWSEFIAFDLYDDFEEHQKNQSA